jgi:DNA processing protein
MTPEELLGPLNEVERKNAPKCLFVAGDVELLRNGPRMSVVGSRAVSSEGATRARLLTKALVNRGIVVVSGLAEGVDTVAHETALSEGGRTVAVLGTPLDETFPAKNKALQARLIREQLVISQFSSGSPSQKKNFPMRNRTMALFTDATVIVEAGEKSGTLHQGWEALRLGRLLFLMESVAHDPTLSWPAEMIRYGAQVLSRENLELVLDEMPEFSHAEPVTL